MAETENETKPQNGETEKKSRRDRFTILVFFASILSLGSLAWTTFSLLDFFQPGGFDLAHIQLKDINPMGLAAAGTADISWSLTMVAQYRGNRLMLKKPWGEKEAYDLLPWIGWAEVLFVAALLAKHGSTMGSGGASFAAALPLLTKLGWIVALADLKDPTAPTPEELEIIAEKLRRSNVKLEEIKATKKEHEAELEAKRRKNAALLEDKRADGEMKKLEKQNEFELEEMQLTGENNLKAMRYQLKAELDRTLIRSRQEVQELQEEFDFNMQIRRRPQTIVGRTVPQSIQPQPPMLGITDGAQEEQAATSGLPDLASLGLTPPEMRQAEMALHYYTVDAQFGGGITKKAFCEKNEHIHPPRLSEATTAFPRGWFMERGLATWVTTQV